MFDKQEVFNKMVTHLRKQGKRAVDSVGRCMYRAPDGTKCAVGALIPDELYDPSMEGLPANNRVIMDAIGVPLKHLSFISDCQLRLHDLWPCHFDESWEGRVRSLAEVWCLSVPPGVIKNA